MNKTILTIVIYVFGLFAVATALLAIIGGTGAEIGGKVAVPSVDSQFRYVNVFWLAAGLILWWTARKPLERALVTRTVLVIAAVAGLGRIISAIAVGLPAPFYFLTFGLEVIATPLVVIWHSRAFPVARRAAEVREPAAK